MFRETEILPPSKQRGTWVPGGRGRPPKDPAEKLKNYLEGLRRRRIMTQRMRGIVDPKKRGPSSPMTEEERKRRKNLSDKRWADQNRDRINARVRARRAANPERERLKRQRRQADPTQNLSSRMRNSIRRAFKHEPSDKKGRTWESLVGYTVHDLIAHIERQFRGRMTWENFGRWHVDHIIPVSAFTFASVDDPEFRACWALSNLRPMWARPNRVKSARRELLL